MTGGGGGDVVVLDDESKHHDEALLRARQLRLGLLMMITLTAHNLPEGIAVAVGTLANHRSGVVITAAIAMHNIPEVMAGVGVIVRVVLSASLL